MPCTKVESALSLLSLAGLTGTGIGVWKFVVGTKREAIIDKIFDLCKCPFPEAPVPENCTSDPIAYCRKLDGEAVSLDGLFAAFYFLTPLFITVTAASVVYLSYSSYKAGGRVYQVVQNIRQRAGYEEIAESASNPPL